MRGDWCGDVLGVYTAGGDEVAGVAVESLEVGGAGIDIGGVIM